MKKDEIEFQNHLVALQKDWIDVTEEVSAKLQGDSITPQVHEEVKQKVKPLLEKTYEIDEMENKIIARKLRRVRNLFLATIALAGVSEGMYDFAEEHPGLNQNPGIAVCKNMTRPLTILGFGLVCGGFLAVSKRSRKTMQMTRNIRDTIWFMENYPVNQRS